jgi:ATP-dependent Lon protease
MPNDETLLAEIAKLQEKVAKATLPEELKLKIDQMVVRLQRMVSLSNYTEEYEKTSHYIDWVVSLPWDKTSQDTLDIQKTKEVFEKHHYGMQDVKERFLEYVSVLALKAKQNNTQGIVHAPVLLLHGLVGTGKTTFAYSLAEALGRKVVRIPFGGMSSARDLRGHSRLHLEAEPGAVIKSLRQAGVRNPVILLDEIDRVADEGRGEIMGVLVELLDPEQNSAYTDNYIDYPFDLSEAIFLATCNNTEKIATAVYDRLEVIEMPSYTDNEKIEIGKHYLLPKALEEAGLDTQHVVISDDVWPLIVRPTGFDAGIRTLQRTIKGMVRKVAKQIVEGTVQSVNLNATNMKEYLPTY